MTNDRFARWSKNDQPNIGEQNDIQLGIAKAMWDTIRQHAPPIHDRPPLTGEGSAPRPKAEPKEIPYGPPPFVEFADRMIDAHLPQPKPKTQTETKEPSTEEGK